MTVKIDINKMLIVLLLLFTAAVVFLIVTIRSFTVNIPDDKQRRKEFNDKMALLEEQKKSIERERNAYYSVISEKNKLVRTLDSLIGINNSIITNNKKAINEIQIARKSIAKFDNLNSADIKKYFAGIDTVQQ